MPIDFNTPKVNHLQPSGQISFPNNLSKFASRLAFGGTAILFITYVLFQKKLLPKPVSKFVARIFFLPTFPITVLMRLGNYWTKVDDTVILGCAPVGLLGYPAQLYQLGVRGVVNMCDEYSGPLADYERLGIKQLHLPTIDHFEPKLVDIQDAVKFIKQYQSNGDKVYVHCKAGHGRGASIALAWMIHENRSSSPKELNSLLKSKRKVRKTLFEQKNMKLFISLLENQQ
eukprot:gene16527-22560_t